MAEKATKEGTFREEIVPVEAPRREANPLLSSRMTNISCRA